MEKFNFQQPLLQKCQKNNNNIIINKLYYLF